MKSKTLIVGILLLAILIVFTAFLFVTRPPTFHGAVIDPPQPAGDIELTAQTGDHFALNALKGRVVVIYFGYTNCPDECPLTMAHLKQALDELGGQAGQVQVLMVSTDPARDSLGALTEFLAKFNPTFLGLTGSTEELQKVYQAYGVTVLDNGETHSNFIYVIDREGRLRLTFLPDSSPDDIAADLRTLLKAK